MITLFRRIREKLIASGSATKYLLYATGEILLVVIGILIALQVNNWNEQRKQNELTNAYLVQLRNELAVNLENSKNTAQFLERKDSLLVKILETDFTTTDPESLDRSIIFTHMNVGVLTLLNDGYQNFIRSTDEVQFRDQELIDEIKFVYVYLEERLRQTSESINEYIQRIIYTISDEQPWFYRLGASSFPEELKTYLKEDSSYKNEIFISKVYYTGNHLASVHWFQYRGDRLYHRLNEELGSRDTSTVNPGKLFTAFSDSTARSLEGKYRSDRGDIEMLLRLKDNELILEQNGRVYDILRRYNGDIYVPDRNIIIHRRENGDLYGYGEVSFLLKKSE
ncbi:DUF6090 family protein [Balneola sp. MJW-20]|uniref:DUF6090 family protein n=1 Tax=Gracilimonas aurantiaca TaxID=3234185 RepID=UPI0034653FFE